jgi:hypothetical protein
LAFLYTTWTQSLARHFLLKQFVCSFNKILFCNNNSYGVHIRGIICTYYTLFCGPGYLSRYNISLLAGPSGDRIPVWGKIFRTRLNRPWNPPSLLYYGYRVFSTGKTAGAWRWPPTPSSAEVKERVELYLYFPYGIFMTCSRTNFTSLYFTLLYFTLYLILKFL